MEDKWRSKNLEGSERSEVTGALGAVDWWVNSVKNLVAPPHGRLGV